MMLPIQDKEARLTEMECYQATIAYAHRLGRKVSRGTHAGDEALCEAQIAKLERLGYHRGLPPSIEEALNSGDGVK